jgi:hypothetical protein
MPLADSYSDSCPDLDIIRNEESTEPYQAERKNIQTTTSYGGVVALSKLTFL